MEDKLLEQFGLKWSDLDKPGFSGEKETLEAMLASVNKNNLTLENIKDYIISLRENAERELVKVKETPNSWLSLLSLFIPLVGIIRKWYLDKQDIEIRSRLRCYLLIESFLSTPEKAKKAIERQLAMFPKR